MTLLPAVVGMGCGIGEAEAVAAFLHRAANAHDDMLVALKAVVRVADQNTAEFDLARAAILKAEGC